MSPPPGSTREKQNSLTRACSGQVTLMAQPRFFELPAASVAGITEAWEGGWPPAHLARHLPTTRPDELVYRGVEPLGQRVGVGQLGHHLLQPATSNQTRGSNHTQGSNQTQGSLHCSGRSRSIPIRLPRSRRTACATARKNAPEEGPAPLDGLLDLAVRQQLGEIQTNLWLTVAKTG